uniref:Secreted venom-protein from the spider Hadronyche infensa n=1 Tax=Hadronyche infensa TaxID=153481 RepID=A0A1D0BWF5_HADIN
MLVPWTVLFIGLIVAVKCDNECTEEKLNICLHILGNEDVEDPKLMFPKKEFLDKHCSPLQEFFRCRINFYQRCPDVESDIDPSANQPMLDLVASICDENSEIRKGYLENVDCYDSSMMRVVVCGATIFAIVEDFEEHNENRTEFQHPDITPCIGLPLFVNCIVEEISEACGNKETSPLADILHRLSDLLVQAACPTDLLPMWEEALVSYLEDENQMERKK